MQGSDAKDVPILDSCFCPQCGNRVPISDARALMCPACGRAFALPEHFEPQRRRYPTDPGRPRPWIRFLARLCDYRLASFLVGLPLGLFVGFVSVWIDQPFPDLPNVVWGMMTIAIWVLLEAVLLRFLGTTPGKALLAVSVGQQRWRKPGFGSALKRSLLVWLHGLGLGIPLISLLTMGQSYGDLKKEGSSMWDRKAKLVTIHRPCGALRVLVAIAWIVGSIILEARLVSAIS